MYDFFGGFGGMERSLHDLGLGKNHPHQIIVTSLIYGDMLLMDHGLAKKWEVYTFLMVQIVCTWQWVYIFNNQVLALGIIN